MVYFENKKFFHKFMNIILIGLLITSLTILELYSTKEILKLLQFCIGLFMIFFLFIFVYRNSLLEIYEEIYETVRA